MFLFLSKDLVVRQLGTVQLLSWDLLKSIKMVALTSIPILGTKVFFFVVDFIFLHFQKI